MKKIPSPFILAGVIVILLFVVFIIWGVPYFFQPTQVQRGAFTFGSQTVLARVTKIVEEGQIRLIDKDQLYQIMQVDVLEGDYKGIPFQVDYGKTSLRSDNFRFAPGDQVYVIINKTPNNMLQAYYVDYKRSTPLAILLAAFVLSILIMGRWKGLGSLIALGISMIMITRYIIPHILGGEDPVKVSLIGSVILLAVTLYLTYGWNLKTHASVLSIMLALLLTGALSLLFVYLARLTGLLIFTLGNGNYGFLINSEFLAEEIVRTLVGSLGLIAAVPISTLIASVLITYQGHLGEWRPLLGPETSDDMGH